MLFVLVTNSNSRLYECWRTTDDNMFAVLLVSMVDHCSDSNCYSVASIGAFRLPVTRSLIFPRFSYEQKYRAVTP